MHDCDSVDIYRTLHSDTRKHSCRRLDSTQRSRPDYFLVSELLGLEIVSADIMPGYCSNHSLVRVVFKTGENSTTHSFEIGVCKPGKTGYFRFEKQNKTTTTTKKNKNNMLLQCITEIIYI